MQVTKEGIYRDIKGNKLPVFNVGFPDRAYFRAYWRGGYYDVNVEPADWSISHGVIEWEMVEFVRDFEIDKDGVKS